VRKVLFRSVAFQNLVHKSCNTRHVPAGGPYSKKSGWEGRLTPRMARYTIFLSDTKVAGNSCFIVLIIVNNLISE
jgi:hypothetical protein